MVINYLLIFVGPSSPRLVKSWLQYHITVSGLQNGKRQQFVTVVKSVMFPPDYSSSFISGTRSAFSRHFAMNVNFWSWATKGRQFLMFVCLLDCISALDAGVQITRSNVAGWTKSKQRGEVGWRVLMQTAHARRHLEAHTHVYSTHAACNTERGPAKVWQDVFWQIFAQL